MEALWRQKLIQRRQEQANKAELAKHRRAAWEKSEFAA